MLTALEGENPVFRSFVFKMLTALGVGVVVGHKVAMQSVLLRLGRCDIIGPFLLRVRGDEAKDRARSSAGVLPVPITATASRE